MGEEVKQTLTLNVLSSLLEILILIVAASLAFLPRLLSILRYESVIHEFDPYFNYRSTQYLVDEGIYKFHNWFDDRAWYPLGRIVGGTVYPGLMWSGALVYKICEYLGFPIDVRNSCVFVSPVWASFTVWVTYLITKSVWNKRAALIASILVSIVPGYISRSVAGSFDNECISIFALLLVFYLWIRAVQTGTMLMSLLTSLAYFYMASAWGGYVFIINLIPLYVVVMLVFGRYSTRLHVAYTTFYLLGILLSMQIQFVSFMPVQSGEHLAAFGAFGLLNLVGFIIFLKNSMTWDHFVKTIKIGIVVILSLVVVAGGALMWSGYITPWTGRFYNLLHPTYAKSHIPIIASVSEHQPTAWPHFFFDLHINSFLFVGALIFAFNKVRKEPGPVEDPHNKPNLTAITTSAISPSEGAKLSYEDRRRLELAKNDGLFFIIVYSCASLYFSGVMVRLMLVLAPASCIFAAIAFTQILENGVVLIQKNFNWARLVSFETQSITGTSKKPVTSKKGNDGWEKFATILPFIVLGVLSVALILYGFHCIWVTSEAYSNPSIVFSYYTQDGTRVMIDDFREAYSWLRHNTDVNARVMSWWDYGYQITAVANRTVLVDNNTWNNSHIATVGTAMSSTEEDAYPIWRYLDVDYILVLFGGLSGYSSDDINKFLWMVRIGGGVFPRIKEPDYLSLRGEYRVDDQAGPAFLKCMMYKMCYYQFGQITTRGDQPPGFDLARNTVIGNKDISFKHLHEAYTSERWIVRIFKVLKEDVF